MPPPPNSRNFSLVKKCFLSPCSMSVLPRGDLKEPPCELVELFEEAHVVLEEEAYVVELVHEAAHAVYAEAEGEAGELFGVNSDGAQDVRVDHAGAAQLYPARALAEAAAAPAALEAG